MSHVRLGDRGSTVAVVNDDRVSLTRMSGVLEGNGYSVLKYDSAEELLSDESSAARSDLIITDLHMPDIDGWRLVRLLRSSEYETFNEVPILVVSATFSGTDTEQISADIGADGFLSSPAPSEELLDQVATLLRGARPERNPRVLLVEDSQSLLHLLVQAFKDEGYLTETAETLAGGREALTRRSYDVVVIDYHLPDGTGDVLLAELRSLRPDTAGIVITSDSDPRLAVSLMRAGASGYLRKPFEPEYLLELCARARRERALLRVEELFEERTAELRESEQQKSLLLREVHHRMKNDMQLVQGTLMLQSDRIDDPAVRQHLDNAVSRVGVMARVYDALYGRQDYEYVNTSAVIETLTDALRGTTLSDGITLETRIEDIEIEARLSTSVGLILNEIVTNAAKHAFAGVDDPRILLTLERETSSSEGHDMLRLTVSDNGNGLPPEVGAAVSSSDAATSGQATIGGFGMEMVGALVEQHDGELTFESKDRTFVVGAHGSMAPDPSSGGAAEPPSANGEVPELPAGKLGSDGTLTARRRAGTCVSVTLKL